MAYCYDNAIIPQYLVPTMNREIVISRLFAHFYIRLKFDYRGEET